MIISPLSTINAFVEISQATNGNSLNQLKKALNFNESESNLLDYYLAYQKSIKESAQSSTFIVANRLFVPDWYQVNEKFQEIATQKLSSGVQKIDYRNVFDAAKIINNFAAEKTQNKVNDIIKPEKLDVDTRIILTNNVYFKLNFEKVF